MPFASTYILIASMGVDPAYEDLFNEVYDEHVAHIRTVPGVGNVTRLKGEAARIAVGGIEQTLPAPEPVYAAVYEIDDPSVLLGAEWARACEAGRWASEVRPHTKDRKHLVYKVR